MLLFQSSYPGAARCVPKLHQRLHRLYRGGQGGERAHWRNDASPRTVRAKFRKKKRSSNSSIRVNISTHLTDDDSVAGHNTSHTNDTSQMDTAAQNTENIASVSTVPPTDTSTDIKTDMKPTSASAKTSEAACEGSNSPTKNTLLKKILQASPANGRLKPRHLSLKQSCNALKSTAKDNLVRKTIVYSPSSRRFVTKSPREVLASQRRSHGTRARSVSGSGKRLQYQAVGSAMQQGTIPGEVRQVLNW